MNIREDRAWAVNEKGAWSELCRQVRPDDEA
jgi:hypothetical protein